MFAPVVKAVHVARRGRRGRGRGRGAAVADAVTAPTRPVYLEIATDLLGAPRCRRSRDAARAEPAARSRSRPAGSRGAVALLDGAERPLIWAGGGARDAGAEVARAGRAARRAGAHDLRRGRRAAARPPAAWSGCRRTSSRRARLWDEADVVLAIGSDLDGVQTQNFAQPQPPTLIAVNARARPVELPRRHRARRATRPS